MSLWFRTYAFFYGVPILDEQDVVPEVVFAQIGVLDDDVSPLGAIAKVFPYNRVEDQHRD